MLLVAATSQLSGTLRIIDRMPVGGHAEAEVGGGPKGSSEALSELAAKDMHRRRRKWIRSTERSVQAKHRRRGRGRALQLLAADATPSASNSSAESVPESSSNSRHNISSDSEAEDDLVVILEDHTNSMPPHLLALESRPANRQPLRDVKPLRVACGNCHHLRELASISRSFMYGVRKEAGNKTMLGDQNFVASRSIKKI